MSLEDVKEIARMTGGTIEEISGPLPDGSGFAMMSMPLPEDHWIYQAEVKFADGSGYCGEPPAPLRMGTRGMLTLDMSLPKTGWRKRLTKNELADLIREVGKYAVRATTQCGKEMDFDPDAMLQNLVVGFLGYWTEDGLSHSNDMPIEQES